MTVAWIGSRETSVKRAAEHAASLLRSSRCPVFSFDTDIHGTRAAIALAERVGAAYDVAAPPGLAAEVALFTTKGGLTVAPGEARRRGDVIVLVGTPTDRHLALMAEFAATVPDLSTGAPRQVFQIGGRGRVPLSADAKRVSAGRADTAAVLGAVRAALAGRAITGSVTNLPALATALEAAAFPVFVFSGHGLDALGLEMLQGLVDDLNRTRRASSLFLPVDEDGWGSVIASTWMTGFPPRTGFARGMPEFDPWRFDVARMVAEGEADLCLSLAKSADGLARKRNGMGLIALAATDSAIRGASVTFSIGVPSLDHPSVAFSARTGTLRARPAARPSARPPAVDVLGLIASHYGGAEASPC